MAQTLLCQGMVQKEPGIALWLVASRVSPWALGTQGLLFPSTKQTFEEGLLSIKGSELKHKKQQLQAGSGPGTLHSELCAILPAAL